MTAEPSSGEPDFEFNSLFQPEFAKAPQPYYQRMRAAHPVLRTADMYGAKRETVFVAKHGDIEFALRNPDLFSSEFLPAGTSFPLIPVSTDPPEHGKYRRLLNPFFAPRQMNKLSGDITRRANELIDRFIAAGSCDYAQEFAVPLPCGVFLDLMGLPTSDLDLFLQIKEALLRGQGDRDRVTAAQDQATERFERLIVERREDPRDDLLTFLVNAKVEDQPLTDAQLLGICNLMLVAGLDTVTDSLTCFYALLGRDADLRRRLAQDPEVIPHAVEELLRYESPVPFVPRIATTEVELSGCPVHPGDYVVLLLGSANTDHDAHDRPEIVDFDRFANRHLGFGGGIHRCLGSHLARLELGISLREWHRRIPDYHIPDDHELVFSPLLRQVEHLPLVLGAAGG